METTFSHLGKLGTIWETFGKSNLSHLHAMTTQKTTWEPCMESRFWEMLGCVPPAYQSGGAFLMGEPYTHRKCRVTGEIRGAYQGFREHENEGFQETSEPLTRPEFFILLKA
jgi:hypothetical protein